LKKICIKISLVKCKVRNENFGIIFGSNVVWKLKWAHYRV
jgi:hypothetical protein